MLRSSAQALIDMSLKELKENRIIAAQLTKLMGAGKTVHAFLFIGPDKPARELGTAFAKALLCEESLDDSCDQCLSCRKFDHSNHEDFTLVERSENRAGLVVSQIEELQKKLQYKAFGSTRVALIAEAQLLNTASQNKLLKTLEEPAPGTVLILLADSRENLLPTILSRCSCYYLQESASDYSLEATETAKQFALLISKNAPFYKKKDCIKQILASKDEARGKGLEFLGALEEELHGMLTGGSCDINILTSALRQTEEAVRGLKMSYNTAYVLKSMCIRIDGGKQ